MPRDGEFGRQTPAPYHVLIVDDDPPIAAAAAAVFETWAGLKVHHATDAVLALRHMARHHYDLVVTDLHMPGLDGLGLIQGARQNGYRGAIIVRTGSSDPDELANVATAVGAPNVLDKADGVAALLARAQVVLLGTAAAHLVSP